MSFERAGSIRASRAFRHARGMCLLYFALPGDETSHTNPKCKRGNGLTPSLTLRVSVPSGRVQYISLSVLRILLPTIPELSEFSRNLDVDDEANHLGWAFQPDVSRAGPTYVRLATARRCPGLAKGHQAARAMHTFVGFRVSSVGNWLGLKRTPLGD
jgi:hypothetical protein